MIPLQLLLDVVGVVLIDVENNELRGMMRRYLPTKLAADRSAASRDEDGFILDVAYDLLDIDVHLFPAEQILYLHFAEIGNGHLSVR